MANAAGAVESLPSASCSFVFVPPAVLTRHRSVLPVVTPGEPLHVESGFLRGHGTMLRDDGALVATVAGVVERVNKLVSVRPLRSRYNAEVGDVVVCRIAEVGARRWKANVNARQEAILMLSSINLPGGEQRRRTAEDQLNMRQFYVEEDLVSAEVQTFFQDGAMSLHTRSLKYGKLVGGTLVTVSPSLMKRLKQHFHTFDFGVEVIFGMNGYVWVCPAKKLDATQPEEETMLNEAVDRSLLPREPPTVEERLRVARVRNALLVLERLCIAVSPASVNDVYQASIDSGVPVRHMLLPHVMSQLCKAALGPGAGTAPEAGTAEMDTR